MPLLGAVFVRSGGNEGVQDLCRRTIHAFLERAQEKCSYAKMGLLSAHAEALLATVDLRTVLLLMRNTKKEDFDLIVEAWSDGDPAPLLLKVRFLLYIT